MASDTKDHNDPGRLGERLAVKFLQKRGYKILQTNFHSRFGEIDIIALDNNILVFVEVKTRWNKIYGPPEVAITRSKIKSITKTGYYFKLLHPTLPDSLRLDAILIEIENRTINRIELIKNLTS